MRLFSRLLEAYDRIGLAVIPAGRWTLFTKAVATAFLIYWLHLHKDLNDWLGTEGFHIRAHASAMFPPLPSPYPSVLWWSVFIGGSLLYFNRLVFLGSLMAGAGLFYATMCDWTSIGALNMHFLFTFAVIYWSCSLRSDRSMTMSAWPVYLIRAYLVVVYFGSGWRKAIYGNWLSDPYALLHCLSGYYVTNVSRWLYPLTPHFVWILVQYISLGFELGAPLLLLAPSLRKWGALLGCMLHIGIALLMKDLYMFSIQMLTFYIPLLTPVYGLSAASTKDNQSLT